MDVILRIYIHTINISLTHKMNEKFNHSILADTAINKSFTRSKLMLTMQSNTAFPCNHDMGPWKWFEL
jgi:hypothetical protein